MIIQSRLQKIPRYWTEPIYKFSSWLSDNLKIKQVQDIWQKQLKEGKIYLTHSLRVQSIVAEIWWQDPEDVSHIQPVIRE